jgi:hypothetical protein
VLKSYFKNKPGSSYHPSLLRDIGRLPFEANWGKITRPYLKKQTEIKSTGDVAQVVEQSHNKHKALNSISSSPPNIVLLEQLGKSYFPPNANLNYMFSYTSYRNSLLK